MSRARGAVAKAAREAGADRLVHISAIGADRKSHAAYARDEGRGRGGGAG